MDNAADRKDVRRREKAAKIVAAQRQAVIHNLMSTIEGRHYIWDKLTECHIFSTTFNGDALQSAYMEGQRAIGLSILSDILIACPDYYIQAMRESNVRDTVNERRSSPEHDGRDSGSSDGEARRDNPDYDPFNTSGRYVDDTGDDGDEARH